MREVTREWIEENKTARGGWNNAQIAAIGESWPPKQGWIERSVGRQITDEAAANFELYGRERPSKSERKKLREAARSTESRGPKVWAEPKHTPRTETKAEKKMELHELSVLARDILRCSGRTQAGLPLFGAVASAVCEIVGQEHSGGIKAFMRTHRERLRAWCQENWIPRDAPQKKMFKPKVKKTSRPSIRSAITYPVTTTQAGVNVTSDEFLQTFEWRRLRMEALKKYGPVCLCCGATPKTGAVMNVDHIKPRKLFPHLALDLNNLQVLCHECNHGKGNWDQTDWRPQTAIAGS